MELWDLTEVSSHTSESNMRQETVVQKIPSTTAREKDGPEFLVHCVREGFVMCELSLIHI